MSLDADFRPFQRGRPYTRRERRRLAAYQLDRAVARQIDLEDAMQAKASRKLATIEGAHGAWERQFAVLTSAGLSPLEIRQEIRKVGADKSDASLELALGWYDEWFARGINTVKAGSVDPGLIWQNYFAGWAQGRDATLEGMLEQLHAVADPTVWTRLEALLVRWWQAREAST